MRGREHSVWDEYEPASHASNSDPDMSVMRIGAG